MAHPYYLPKVVGHIELSDAPKKHKCICDECGSHVDDSWGDPRVEVFRYDSKHAKDPSSIRWICECCVDELFGNHEPHSIFG